MGVFEQACILSNESFLKTIPDVLPEPQYSRKHIRAMNRIINKMRNDRYHRLTTGTIKALVVAAVILSLALSAFAIPSIRDYVITQFKTHSVFRTVSTEDSQPVTDLTVGYIPEGFELVEKNEDKFGIKFKYCNESNDWIVVYKLLEKNEIGFDTQDFQMKRKTANNGIEYLIYKTYNNNFGVIWHYDNYIYYIEGIVSQEDLIKIAHNVK